MWFQARAEELHVGIEGPCRPALKAHPALRVRSTDTLEELAKSLTVAGVELRGPTGPKPRGQRRFHASYPRGNRLELVASPTG